MESCFLFLVVCLWASCFPSLSFSLLICNMGKVQPPTPETILYPLPPASEQGKVTHWLSVGSLRSSGRTLKNSRRCGQREILTGRPMSVLQYSVSVPWRLSVVRCPSNHLGADRTMKGRQRNSEHILEVKSKKGWGKRGQLGGQVRGARTSNPPG